MKKKLLLLGHTGKLGLALNKILGETFDITGKNSKNFDVNDFSLIEKELNNNSYDTVINTIAFKGVDQCEESPEKAFKLNVLFPQKLAFLQKIYDFRFIHISSDAVFDSRKDDYYYENDPAYGQNIYGVTKLAGDSLVLAEKSKSFVIRVPMLFGPSLKREQFVEKMVDLAKSGCAQLNIAHDITLSYGFTHDIALKLKYILENDLDFGLYHVANHGMATLYEFLKELFKNLNFNIKLTKASFHDFPFKGIKNTFTPISSKKIEHLRSWQEGLKDYCKLIKD